MDKKVWRYKNLEVENYEEVEKVLHSWGKWGWECYQIIFNDQWKIFLKRAHLAGMENEVND